MDREKGLRLPFAKEGAPFFIVSFLLSFLFFLRDTLLLSILFLLLSFFFLFFFRNPERETIEGEIDILVSPADGRVIDVGVRKEEDLLGEEMRVISIFMSLFDVHVNRSPCDGLVKRIERKKGGFRLAFKKGSDDNTRNVVLIDKAGDLVVVKQIAGFLARRIFCYWKVGDTVKRGEPLGIIAFGSRVDLYVRKEYHVLVREGQKVRAGVTAIARKGGGL